MPKLRNGSKEGIRTRLRVRHSTAESLGMLLVYPKITRVGGKSKDAKEEHKYTGDWISRA